MSLRATSVIYNVIMAAEVGEGNGWGAGLYVAAAWWCLAGLWSYGPTDQLTTWMVWIRLNSSTSFHFLSSAVWEFDWGIGVCVCVRVCARACARLLLHLDLIQWLWQFSQEHWSTWLFIGFQHVLLCRRRCSHELQLTHWRAHVILCTCTLVRQQCCFLPKP